MFHFTMRIIKRSHHEARVPTVDWAQALAEVFTLCYSHSVSILSLVLAELFLGNMPISNKPLNTISQNLARKCHGK